MSLYLKDLWGGIDYLLAILSTVSARWFRKIVHGSGASCCFCCCFCHGGVVNKWEVEGAT